MPFDPQGSIPAILALLFLFLRFIDLPKGEARRGEFRTTMVVSVVVTVIWMVVVVSDFSLVPYFAGWFAVFWPGLIALSLLFGRNPAQRR